MKKVIVETQTRLPQGGVAKEDWEPNQLEAIGILECPPDGPEVWVVARHADAGRLVILRNSLESAEMLIAAIKSALDSLRSGVV